MKKEQLYGITRISFRQKAADYLLNKVEEELRLIDWFKELDSPIKQNMLVKYALLRMYQSSVLNDLEGLHAINDNLRTDINLGKNNELREAEEWSKANGTSGFEFFFRHISKSCSVFYILKTKKNFQNDQKNFSKFFF